MLPYLPNSARRITPGLTAPIVCLAVFALVAALASAQAVIKRDNITLTNKQVLMSVTVLREDARQVELDTAGKGVADKTIPQDEVLKVDYGDAPPAFRTALAAFRQGLYDKAFDQFTAAAAATGVRPWFKDYLNYYLAECLRMQIPDKPALAAQALKAYQDAIAASPDGPFRDGLAYGMGRLLLDQGKVDDALKQFDQLERTGLKQEFKLGAQLGLADARMLKGQPADAIKLYDAVLAKGEDASPAIYREAVLAKAKALVAQKQFSEAASFLHGVLKQTRSAPLLSQGYLALGDCCFQEADSIKDPKDARSAFKEALFAYLRIEVLYPQDSASLPKALYYSGKCFQKLGQDDRAQEKWAQLKSKFPTSPWTDKTKS